MHPLILAALQQPTVLNMEELMVLVDEMYGEGSYTERMEMETSGIVVALVDILKKRRTDKTIPGKVFTIAWSGLLDFVDTDDMSDPREFGPGSPINVCFKLGVFDLCMDELVANLIRCTNWSELNQDVNA